MIFDHAGQVAGVDQMEHEQIYPQAGWVEHDPMEIWARSQDVVKAGLEKSGVKAEEISAIGVTNQRETTVVWDKNTGKPYYNAIVWQCTRTKDICDALAEDGGQDRFRAKVGLPLATYFSGPKIKWILDNVDGVRAAAEKGDAIFGNIDTFEIWWLTGGPKGGAHVTDVSNASRTMLMNLETLDWDQEILDLMGIPRQMLPEVRPSSDPNVWGYTPKDGPFGAAIPVCGDLGDQQGALVGQTCFSPGEAKNTYGTGCFMLLNTGTKAVPSESGLLTTLGYKFGDAPAVYCLEGSIAITGALVQWLRDNLNFFEKSSQVEELANTVEDNGGIYFVPAFSGLRRPDPLRQQGALCPRRAGGHRLPDPRGAGRDEQGLWRGSEGPQGGRRHGLQRDPDAVPGRHPGRARHSPDGGRDHRVGRVLRRWSGCRLLGEHRRAARELGHRQDLGAQDGRRGPRKAPQWVAQGRHPHLRLGVVRTSTPEHVPC
jgi:glycerol kinase